MNQEYPMWLEIKNRIHNTNDTNYSVIMVGDSRAKAGYIPNILNKYFKNVNLSLGGGSPIEGFYTLKTYLKNHKKPKKLILSYTPTHLGGDSCYWERTVYFDFLDDKTYQNIEKQAKELNETVIIKDNKSYKDFKYPKVYSSSFKNGIRDMRWERNKIVYQECKNAHGHHFFGTKEKADRFNVETKEKYFIPSALQNYYLEKMIMLAQEKNIKVYFYNMPFNESSYKKVKPQYKEAFEKHISQIAKKYHIKLCNKLWYLKNENFGDPSHLYRGARLNTLKVYNCIKD
jgi:hypothetical protein